MKRTPLFAAHQKSGARLIEFGGWEMPVFYTSITDEHQAVRRAAGLFDISHMGEVQISGPGALEFLNTVMTNDVRKLTVGQGQYSLMCNSNGGVIDDLYVYRLGQQEFLLIINASRINSDVAWLQTIKQSLEVQNLTLEDVSDSMAAVALQGPACSGIIDASLPVCSAGGTQAKLPSDLKKNQTAYFPYRDDVIQIARTGYTGEDGFELVMKCHLAESVWGLLLDRGAALGLKPCGLGARDTLRTEVCYPLYGHELDENTTPLDAGLGFFVAFDKGQFIGRDRLAAQKLSGTEKKLVAFKMTGRSAPPRPDYQIVAASPDGSLIGKVTSGTQSPSLNLGIGLGYVKPAFAKPDTTVHIEIRGKPAAALIVPKPIYRKPS